METTSAPQNAGQNPATWKPSPNRAAAALVNQRIRALITKVKSPRVRIRRGHVSIVRSGRTSAFNNPKTSATTRNVTGLGGRGDSGTIRVATQSAAALMRSRRRKRIPGIYPLLLLPARARERAGVRGFAIISCPVPLAFFAARSVFRIERIRPAPPAAATRKKSMARPG